MVHGVPGRIAVRYQREVGAPYAQSLRFLIRVRGQRDPRPAAAAFDAVQQDPVDVPVAQCIDHTLYPVQRERADEFRILGVAITEFVALTGAASHPVRVRIDREHPYPKLVGEIVLEEHSVSERHHEKVGVQYKKDKNPYRTAKGALKALKIHYLDRLQVELYQQYQAADGGERKKVMKSMKEAGRQRTRLQQSPIDELFPDPDSEAAQKVSDNVFEYKMKHEREE